MYVLVGAAVGTLLSFPALWHFVSQLSLSSRATLRSVDEVMGGALPVKAFWNLINPYLDMQDAPTIDRTMSRYHALGTSIPLLLFSLYRRYITKKWNFYYLGGVGLFAICTLLSFGDGSGVPLRRWLAEYFSIYRMGRFPSGEHSFFGLLFLVFVGAEAFKSSKKLIALMCVDFIAVMVVTLPYRYMRLPTELQGTLVSPKIEYGPKDADLVNAPRICEEHVPLEMDQRKTFPDKFSTKI
jgi:hypothetical protein